MPNENETINLTHNDGQAADNHTTGGGGGSGGRGGGGGGGGADQMKNSPSDEEFYGGGPSTGEHRDCATKCKCELENRLRLEMNQSDR